MVSNQEPGPRVDYRAHARLAHLLHSRHAFSSGEKREEKQKKRNEEPKNNNAMLRYQDGDHNLRVSPLSAIAHWE
jgi:hypothetical protein